MLACVVVEEAAVAVTIIEPRWIWHPDHGLRSGHCVVVGDAGAILDVMPDVAPALLNSGYDSVTSESPAATDARIAAETPRWRHLVEISGARDGGGVAWRKAAARGAVRRSASMRAAAEHQTTRIVP